MDNSLEVNEAVNEVFLNKEKWANTTNLERLAYLTKIHEIAESIATEWVANCGKLRNDPHLESSSLAWYTAFGAFGAGVRALWESYNSLVANGRLPAPPKIRTVNDQIIVTVYPARKYEASFMGGYTAEIWLEPHAPFELGKTLENREPGVVAILGAGNFEAPTDILHKLFHDNKVCVYKPNPVNQLNAPFVEKLFEPLIKEGFVRIVGASMETSKLLVHHPKVDEVMMTGSAATYDKIVWGDTTEEQQRNKEAGNKLMNKPFHAELGGVTPFIVVPSKWTDSEVSHHAQQAAATRLCNGGHICCATQVVVLDKDWPQKDAFLKELKKALASAIHHSYYPGTDEKCDRYLREIPNAEKIEGKTGKVIYIPEHPVDGKLTKEETFGPVIAVVSLEGTEGDAEKFLTKAVEYCNMSLYGSLSATLIAHPNVNPSIVDNAVANLLYGTIGVNIWAGYGNIFPVPWGAHTKRHKPEDIQSGDGKITNPWFISYPQKSVIKSPFIAPNHPIIGKSSPHKIFERSGYFLSKPSLGRLIGVIGAAVIGI